MKRQFYSDYACTLISCWPEDVAELIAGFALQLSKVRKETGFLRLVSAKEINEAAEDSDGLVKEYLKANVNWQESLNSLSEKSQEIASDLDFLTDIIQTVIDNPKNPELSLDEMNIRFTEIKSQEELPARISKWLDTWRTENLVPTMKKWQQTIITQHDEIANAIISQLKINCKIDLSEIEKSEITNPTKTREELLNDLQTFFPNGFPKGFNRESEIMKLRSLWAVGAYLKRTFTTDEKSIINCIRKTILASANTQRKFGAKTATSINKELSGLIKAMLDEYEDKIDKIEIMTQSERAELAIRRSDMLAKQRLKTTPQAAPEL